MSKSTKFQKHMETAAGYNEAAHTVLTDTEIRFDKSAPRCPSQNLLNRDI